MKHIKLFEQFVNESKYPKSQYKWDAKHPYTFTIHSKDGDKHHTDWFDLESAKKMKAVLDKDRETYSISKSNDGKNLDDLALNQLESLDEAIINELSADTYKNTVKTALQRGDSKGNSLAAKALESFGKEIAKELAGKSFEVKGSRKNITDALYKGSSMSYINQALMTFTGMGSLMHNNIQVFGSDEVHFLMDVEFQLPDNWGGWSGPVKFNGYKNGSIPATVQFSIKGGKIWVWFKAADTDLEFTRAGAREMAKLADTIVAAMDFPTKAKHNTIKQFDPIKPSNESVNEGKFKAGDRWEWHNVEWDPKRKNNYNVTKKVEIIGVKPNGEVTARVDGDSQEFIVREPNKYLKKKLNEAVNPIIDVISNSIEDMDETDFADYMSSEFGWDQDLSLEVFNSYWNLGAKDRMKYDEKDWKNWLKKHGVKI